MKPEDDIRFICWPPSMIGKGVVPGTTTRHCRVCLQEVFVAPSTLKEFKKRKLRDPIIWCVPCAMRQPGFKEAFIQPPTPEQLEEFEQDARRRRQ